MSFNGGMRRVRRRHQRTTGRENSNCKASELGAGNKVKSFSGHEGPVSDMQKCNTLLLSIYINHGITGYAEMNHTYVWFLGNDNVQCSKRKNRIKVQGGTSFMSYGPRR